MTYFAYILYEVVRILYISEHSIIMYYGKKGMRSSFFFDCFEGWQGW